MDINKYTAIFKNFDDEQEYREYNRKVFWQTTLIVISLSVFAALYFIYNDYLFYGFDSNFFNLFSLRFGFVSASIAALFIVRNTKNYKLHDWVLTLWTACLFALALIINSSRPFSYAYLVILDQLLLITFYFFLSVRFIFKITLAFVFSTLSMYFSLMKGVENSESLSMIIVLSYIMINSMGIFINWQLNYHKRLEYRLYKQEKEEKEQLATALDEIKELKGLLPICANCKNVKDDEGYWQRIETYIQDHTLAKFTHTVCFDCAEELYGKEEWYQEMKKKKEGKSS